MEKIEFWKTPEGELMYKHNNTAPQRFTKFRYGIINSILKMVEENFPECYARLMALHCKDKDSHFKMCTRFISCNLGEHGILTEDVENGMINFERVHCPLRGGLCPHEGVICTPKGVVALPPAEKEVVKLYVSGFNAEEIAAQLGKSKETVKKQLCNAKNRLNLKSCKEITKFIRTKNI